MLFCSVSFRHARPQSTRPTLPAASLYRTVLFCAARSIPFRLARVPTEYRKPVSLCSALFHSGMPAPNLPDLPSRPPVGAAMLCSSRLRSIPFRLARVLTEYRKPVSLCSALFHSGMPAPHDIPCPPPVGAAMLCSTLFHSIPIRFAHVPTEYRKPVSLCSALFHSGMPAPQSTQPILPAASLYRTVMFCTARSIPFRLARVPTECRKPVSLFCSVSFRPVLPYSATNPHCTEADRFGSSITTKKTCTAHQPPLRRATTN